MGIESLSNEELKELGTVSSELAEFWKSELGNNLRGVMAELTQNYMLEVMEGDPHAFRAVRAVRDLANALGDQVLYERAVRVEFERRFAKNGGR